MAAQKEHDHGWHGWKEQARAPARAAPVKGKTGVVVEICLQASHRHGFLHAQDKQKGAALEHQVANHRRNRKPIVVLDYHRNKGGIDNVTKLVGTYSCRRMTARWPLVAGTYRTAVGL